MNPYEQVSRWRRLALEDQVRRIWWGLLESWCAQAHGGVHWLGSGRAKSVTIDPPDVGGKELSIGVSVSAEGDNRDLADGTAGQRALVLMQQRQRWRNAGGGEIDDDALAEVVDDGA